MSPLRSWIYRERHLKQMITCFFQIHKSLLLKITLKHLLINIKTTATEFVTCTAVSLYSSLSLETKNSQRSITLEGVLLKTAILNKLLLNPALCNASTLLPGCICFPDQNCLIPEDILVKHGQGSCSELQLNSYLVLLDSVAGKKVFGWFRKCWRLSISNVKNYLVSGSIQYQA